MFLQSGLLWPWWIGKDTEALEILWQIRAANDHSLHHLSGWYVPEVRVHDRKIFIRL